MQVIEGGVRQFQPGDVVNLKSGGPPMTIIATRQEGVDLAWFGTPDRICTKTIPPVCIEHFKPAQKVET